MADKGVDEVIAFKGELQLAGWSERHNTGAMLTFWLPDADDLEAFKRATARKGQRAGQRYMAVLVEIDDNERPVVQTNEPARYGIFARELKLSPFFKQRIVWEMVGEPEHYHRWLRDQKCAAWRVGGCDGQVAGAHVRRVAEGSGTAIKPDFSEIPLCVAHHEQQHRHAESAINDREWWEKEAMDHASTWAWDRLKMLLGYTSMAHVPPERLLMWAKENAVDHFLPLKYRELSGG